VFASIITSQHSGDRTIFSYHPDNKSDINSSLNFKFNNYSLVLFDGFHPELAIGLAKEAFKNSIPTVLDGGSWKPGLDELLKYIDIAICSHDFKVPEGSDPASVFSHLHGRGVKQVAITNGGNNILCSEGNEVEELAGKPVTVVDTLGAGDIFHGAFCHYYNAGENFRPSIEKASIVASESCKSFGTREWMRKL
jgi:sugar/nucleoside kinase (ribokinase family)